MKTNKREDTWSPSTLSDATVNLQRFFYQSEAESGPVTLFSDEEMCG